ncbi:O-methyltransferase [Elioraea rosea]|uniref:O-methyltransferase n=1 Tax=Elioraea rosea TaxID=2492390 RepID=UPI001181E2FB|nr:class I SAM-dependent methyltransferase [Elioraea rosea]
MAGFLRRLLRPIRRELAARAPLSVGWVRRDDASWLAAHFQGTTFRPPAPPQSALIERIAAETEALGQQALWEGYAEAYLRDAALPWAGKAMTRSSEQVRSQPRMGRVFAWLAATRRPRVIVEVGTAFGISGMYWVAGLEQAGAGEVVTFDPNETWHAIAKGNIARISPRATAVPRTMEDAISETLGGRPVDLCFIDAIHTSEFVRAQLDLILPRLAPGALVLLDDITFSDDMAACWRALAEDKRFRASLALDDRVGLLELP